MRAPSFTAPPPSTRCAPTCVVLRTSFATAKERWKSRCSTVPSVPADCATRTASFSWPRICGSPSTIESRPAATRKAWRTAWSCGSEIRQRVGGSLRLLHRAVELGAVAGGDDRRLGQIAVVARIEVVAQPGDRIADLGGHERQTLTQRKRRSLVVQPEGQQLHRRGSFQWCRNFDAAHCAGS
jgi:hypothetical protein